MIPPIQTERKVFTLKEAQEELGIGKQLLYNLMNSGRLDHMHIGSRHVIPKKAIQDYIDKEIQRERDRRIAGMVNDPLYAGDEEEEL